MSSTPVSGTQHSIRAGGYEAEIASVGASLRSLRHAGPRPGRPLRGGRAPAVLSGHDPRAVAQPRRRRALHLRGPAPPAAAHGTRTRARAPRLGGVARLRRGAGQRGLGAAGGDDRAAGRLPVARAGRDHVRPGPGRPDPVGPRDEPERDAGAVGDRSRIRTWSRAPARSTTGSSSCPRHSSSP